MNFKQYTTLIEEGFKEKEALWIKQGHPYVQEHIKMFKELKDRNVLPRELIDIDS